MIWEKISGKNLKTLTNILAMNRKIEHKCINSRLHTARIDDTLDRQGGEQSESKDNTEIFHTLTVSYFARESKKKTKIPRHLGGFL